MGALAARTYSHLADGGTRAMPGAGAGLTHAGPAQAIAGAGTLKHRGWRSPAEGQTLDVFPGYARALMRVAYV
jgi:hypothetical protein